MGSEKANRYIYIPPSPVVDGGPPKKVDGHVRFSSLAALPTKLQPVELENANSGVRFFLAPQHQRICSKNKFYVFQFHES